MGRSVMEVNESKRGRLRKFIYDGSWMEAGWKPDGTFGRNVGQERVNSSTRLALDFLCKWVDGLSIVC